MLAREHMNKIFNNILKSIFLLLGLLIVWRSPVNGWSSLVWLAGTIIMTVIRKPHIETNTKNIIAQSYQTTTEKLFGYGVCWLSIITAIVT